jgi:hypothetical protein
LLLLCFPLAVNAQKKITEWDKSAKPTGIRFGTDVISVIRIPTDESFNGWEASADIDFYRYFLTAEIGNWSRNYTSANETYANDGTYWRVGVDANFLKKDPEKNMLFLGVRYASGDFNETLTINQNDTWNTTNYVLTNTGTQANWFELTGGIRIKMWKYFWLGYTARYKFALSTNEKGLMKPSDVPGYGSTDGANTWGFNYQLFFRIPLPKKQQVVESNEK